MKEAAVYLGCSESWVYELIASGQIQAIRIGTRKGLRVLLISVRDYLKGKNEGV